jgi:acetyltransferase
MVCELPWLQELDLNPLIVDENGAIAADARIVIDYANASGDRYSHMAIHPYPVHLIQEWEQPDGRTVTIRPIRPEDAEMEQEFVKNHVRRKQVLPLHGHHARTDADRCWCASRRSTTTAKWRWSPRCRTRRQGPCRSGSPATSPIPDGETVEFALAVADDWQKHGVGRKLMSALIECARMPRATAPSSATCCRMNTKMFRLMTKLGFTIHPHPEDPAVKRVVKPLQG